MPSYSSLKPVIRRDSSFIVRDLITALALCHNVTPVYPDMNNPDYREF